MENGPLLSIGLMSGTSMDGIDAALLETDGSPTTIYEHWQSSFTYPAEFKILLKAAEYSIRKSANKAISSHKSNVTHIHDDAHKNFSLDFEVFLHEEMNWKDGDSGLNLRDFSVYLNPDDSQKPLSLEAIIQHSTFLHGVLVKDLMRKAGKGIEDIDVIGCHGQTFFHKPRVGISIILNDGQNLADETGIAVINDFRSQDIKAGGQGAPLAPLYHQALAIKDKKWPCAVVNCGGIANITIIPNDKVSDILGFDTGPGNGLIDRFVKQRTNGREHMDMDGHYGLRGTINESVLKVLFEKSLRMEGANYFDMAPPKSLDIGDMGLIPELESLSLEDGCATLEAFTAESIVRSLAFMNTNTLPTFWILVGGGWYNPVIRRELEKGLKQRIDKVKVHLADEIGWKSQAMEAQVFAYLAVRSLYKKPISLPGTTKVPKPTSGGTLFIPKTGASLKVRKIVQCT